MSTMSREPPNSPPRSRPDDVASGGTLRRSIDNTIDCGSGLLESGPEAMKAAMPPIAIRVRVPTVASRPTINRRMASLRSAFRI